jgi:hypothetical protein
VAAAVLVIVLSGAGERDGTSSSANTSGSCAAVIEWRGATYSGARAQRPLRFGAALGRGTVPACLDTPGSPGSELLPVALVEVVGLLPAQAVGFESGDFLYLAPGYFPQQPRTPLHDALYGTHTDVPDERGDDCGDATVAEVRATVLAATFGSLRVELEDARDLPARTWIFPDARTLITGGGTPPHVSPGDSVRAQVLVCRKPDEPQFLKLVATRLALGE